MDLRNILTITRCQLWCNATRYISWY